MSRPNGTPEKPQAKLRNTMEKRPLEKTPSTEENAPKLPKSEKPRESENEILATITKLFKSQSEELETRFEEMKQETRAAEERIKESVGGRIERLETQVSELAQENQAARVAVESLTEKNKILEARLRTIEREARSLNLVVTGIQSESPRNSTEEAIN